MKSNPILSICIPTYNRLALLKKNITKILPQITKECKLIIIDNHSDYNSVIELKPILDQFPNINCELIINKTNIGGNANILRCFELCETKWLYIIGDDDQLANNGIKRILEDIKKYTNFYTLNYQWFPEKNWNSYRPIITLGVYDFIEKIESISKILFISSNVYNINVLKKFLYIGYQYQMTNAPHLSILLYALAQNKNSKVFLSQFLLVYNGYDEVPSDSQWNMINFFQNIRLLLDLPIEEDLGNKLFIKINNSFSLKMIIYRFVNEVNQMNSNQLLINLNKTFSYFTIYEKNWGKKLILRLTKWFFHFPKIIIFIRGLVNYLK